LISTADAGHFQNFLSRAFAMIGRRVGKVNSWLVDLVGGGVYKSLWRYTHLGVF